MEKNMPEQFDDSVRDIQRMNMGNCVGELAMGYFGDFTEVPWSDNKSEMLHETELLIQNRTPVICEAAFTYEGNFCIVDILRVFNDCVEIVEVKSSTREKDNTSGKIADIYLHDMAYQYYVLTNCGLNVRSVSLMNLNSSYVRQGELDIKQLFVLTDCTDSVSDMQTDIPDRLNAIEKVALSDNEPEIVIGSRCDSPYECGYKGWCWRHLPEDNVFTIGMSMRGSVKEEAYLAGKVSFADVLNGEVKLSERQRRRVETVLFDLPPYINKPGIKAFLDGLSYPVYHFDFETFQQPIPLWDGVRPYMHIPFQYSLHIQHEDGSLTHKEFLGKEGEDPRRALAERICEDIPPGACVLAWYMPFEKGRLSQLAELFPDLAGHLLNIDEDIQDLRDPFSKGDYYCKEMGGSSSLKTVLPALFPNDPELDYANLELIHHGGEAMEAFATLHKKSPEEIAEIRTALLAYCKMDTLAMVKIFERLWDLVAEEVSP